MLEFLKQYRFSLLIALGMAAAAGLWFLGFPASTAAGKTAAFEGQLTYFDLDRGIFYLQNETTAMRVEADTIESDLEIGQLVAAIGTLTPDRSANTLLSTQIRILKPGLIPDAAPLSSNDLDKIQWHGCRVRLSGRVVGAEYVRLGRIGFQLQLENQKFVEVRARGFDPGIANTLVGAYISLPGILQPLLNSAASRTRYALLVSEADLLSEVQRIRKRQHVTEQPTPKQVLTKVSALRSLSKREAERGFPVSVHGILTFIDADPSHCLAFVKDDTGGVYVSLHRWGPSALQAGQRVLVTGRSAPGSFAPVISNAEIRPEGGFATPQATTYQVSDVLAGRSDGDWLALKGVVRSVEQNKARSQLVFEWNGTRAIAIFEPGVTLPSSLVDATVELQGVSGSTSNLRRQFTGMRLYVPSLACLRIVQPPTPSADLPLKNTEDLGVFTPDTAQVGHREKISGVITYTNPNGPTFIHDRTGDIRIDGAPDRKYLQAGDGVEVLGFPVQDNFGSVMNDAHFSAPRHDHHRPEPRQETAESLQDHGLEGSLVQVEAVLSERFSSEGGEILVMRSGPVVFNARVTTGRAPEADSGSILQLTGICRLTSKQGNPEVATGFNLLLSSGTSVKIVRSAPWWTVRAVLWIVGAVSLLAALVIIWAFALRRQVRRQTSLIRTQLEEAEALRHAAEAAARAKSEFLANMSHEIRTPLNGVLGMAEIALAETMEPTVKEYLQTVRTSGLSLLQIINDVLDLSKIEAGRMTVESAPFNLHQMLAQVVALFQPKAASKQLLLALQYPNDAPRCFLGDGARLRQVVLNLISNAVKFTERGQVVLEAQIDLLEERRASVRISVSDTGLGIPLEAQRKLFQSFTQADASTTRRFGGTGLGLAISRQLCELMGGSLQMVSQPGQGSTFWLELPLPVTDAIPEDRGKIVKAPLPAVSNVPFLRVLLVEDNLINQKVASRLLERLGIQVDKAENGLQAVAKRKENGYSLILMDCQMPLCDGYEATGAIREWERDARLPATPIIALTAHALPGDRERCLQAGMDDYLTKPLRVDDLRRMIEQWALRAAA